MRRRSLGIHIVDVLGRPVSEIPARQNLAILDEIRMTVAGTAAGVSVDMAKLGLEVIAMGAIGNDEIGELLLGVMQRYGIDTEHIRRKAEALPQRCSRFARTANARRCTSSAPMGN
jgi:sugar/nucleoside kinase (ribokinase family)